MKQQVTKEKLNTRRKDCPNATLSTADPTGIVLGSNPSLNDEKPPNVSK